MKAIQDVAAIDSSRLTPYDLAFRIAPRLNAPGRMGGAENGVYLLTTDNPSLAKDLAGHLDRMNNKRQDIEQNLLIQIEETISYMEDLEDRRTLVLSGRDWHKGVLGIVASRLVDRYHRPALVIHLHEGMATGSGRSIDGFNLHKALARHEHLFEKFGGHDRAVGFTLEEIHVEALARGLEDVAQGLLNEADLIPVIEIDAMLRLSDLTLETMNQIESLSPFGSGNPEPVFYTHSLHVVDSRVVGERHLKLMLKQESTVKEAIGFGLGDLHPLKGELVHMVYTPEINEWQGYRKIQLRVLDLDIMDRSSMPVKIHHE
jgi:single-stranded-DNA-specific exonuclease